MAVSIEMQRSRGSTQGRNKNVGKSSIHEKNLKPLLVPHWRWRSKPRHRNVARWFAPSPAQRQGLNFVTSPFSYPHLRTFLISSEWITTRKQENRKTKNVTVEGRKTLTCSLRVAPSCSGDVAVVVELIEKLINRLNNECPNCIWKQRRLATREHRREGGRRGKRTNVCTRRRCAGNTEPLYAWSGKRDHEFINPTTHFFVLSFRPSFFFSVFSSFLLRCCCELFFLPVQDLSIHSRYESPLICSHLPQLISCDHPR